MLESRHRLPLPAMLVAGCRRASHLRFLMPSLYETWTPAGPILLARGRLRETPGQGFPFPDSSGVADSGTHPGCRRTSAPRCPQPSTAGRFRCDPQPQTHAARRARVHHFRRLSSWLTPTQLDTPHARHDDETPTVLELNCLTVTRQHVGMLFVDVTFSRRSEL